MNQQETMQISVKIARLMPKTELWTSEDNYGQLVISPVGSRKALFRTNVKEMMG
jgi:hypothetical protein